MIRMIFLKRLFQNKYFVLADQAFVSLLNFGSIFLLSKFADIPVFANFVLAYGYSNLIFILVTYFLTAPILVFLPKKEEKEGSSYLASLLVSNIILSLFLSLISFPFVNSQVDGLSFLLFLGINFSMIIYDLNKKFIFAQIRVSYIYTVISSFGLVSLFFGMIWYFKDSLSLNIVFGVYTLSFLLSAFFLFIIICIKKFLNWKSFLPTNDNLKKLWKYITEHYTFSKWVVAAGILFWGYSQGIFIVADILGVGDLGIAKVRSIQNLLGLFTILLVSMESYFIPLFSRNVEILSKVVKEFYQKYTLVLAIIFLVSLPVFYFVYDYYYFDKFSDGIYIIVILWLSQLVVVFSRPLSMALKAKEVSYPLFIAHALALFGLASLGILFMYLWKDIGMSLTLFLAYFLSNISIIYFYKKHVTT